MSSSDRRPIGLGSTILARGFEDDGIDGIGVYTEQLLRGLGDRLGSERVRPHVFGQRGRTWSRPHIHVAPSYPIAAPWMALPAQTYPQSTQWSRQLSLFHATDHLIPRLAHTPVVATVMDIIPMRHPEWVRATYARSLMNWLFKRLARTADHIITLSDFSAMDISDGLGIPRHRITAIPLGVQSKFFERTEPFLARATLRKHELEAGYFISIGTLQPRKNIERLLDAHAALPIAIQQAHPLVIVGREGWNAEKLLARLNGQSASVRWLRYLPQQDLLALLQNATALVHPSLYEGFGLPILEGFAAAVPVISSNTTSIPEVAGDAALLINPLSVEELRHAMLRLVEDAALRADLIDKGVKRAQQFTWEATVAATLDVYSRFTDL